MEAQTGFCVASLCVTYRAPQHARNCAKVSRYVPNNVTVATLGECFTHAGQYAPDLSYNLYNFAWSSLESESLKRGLLRKWLIGKGEWRCSRTGQGERTKQEYRLWSWYTEFASFWVSGYWGKHPEWGASLKKRVFLQRRVQSTLRAAGGWCPIPGTNSIYNILFGVATVPIF